MKKIFLKILFGGIIFLFGLTFVYFTASYLVGQQHLDYWLILAVGGILYTIIGLVVVRVFPVSLGFLFAADVLLLHSIFSTYSEIPTIAKTIILGALLLILYTFAFWKEKKDVIAQNSTQQ